MASANKNRSPHYCTVRNLLLRIGGGLQNVT